MQPRWCARHAASPRLPGRSVVSPCWRAEWSSGSPTDLGELLGAVARRTRSRPRSRRRTRRPVDAGEAQVGDLVELAQRAEDRQADLVGGDLGPALEPRSASSTSWPRQARSSSVTGRPLQALRTPAIALSRVNGSVAPERLSTVSCISSTVVNRLLAAPVQAGAGGGSSRRRRRPASRGPGCRCAGSTGSASGSPLVVWARFASALSALPETVMGKVGLCRRSHSAVGNSALLCTRSAECAPDVENYIRVTTTCSAYRSS